MGRSMRHFETRKWLMILRGRGMSPKGDFERRRRQLNNGHLHKNITLRFLLGKVRKATSIEGSVLTEIRWGINQLRSCG